jgi:hypothetical protein
MSNPLVQTIAEQTDTLLTNMRIMLHTCDLAQTVYGMPIWKHVYHALHSLDRWFINPQQYDEPAFHEPDLNSLDILGSKVLSRAGLEGYSQGIEQKIRAYLAELTDDLLAEKPQGCPYTRLALILGQFRHFYAHLGIINGSTIASTGKWPRVIGLDSNFSSEDEYFE